MDIYYPYYLNRRDDEDEMLSLITTANNTLINESIPSIDEIKSLMFTESFNVVVLFWSCVTKDIYSELIFRLIQERNIVILINIDSEIENDKIVQFITHIT